MARRNRTRTTKEPTNYLSIFDDIKSKLFGVPKDKVGSDIDSIVDKITSGTNGKNASVYAETVRELMSDVIGSNYNSKSSNSSREFIQSYISTDRLIRYANAEEIVNCIPYCSRALSIITDEILASDTITKEVIDIKVDDTGGSNLNEDFRNVKNIESTLKVSNYISDIVGETLKFGDHFIEVCDYTNEDIPINKALLTENMYNEGIEDDDYIDIKYNYLSENEGENLVERNIKLKPVLIEASEKSKNSSTLTNKPQSTLQNIRLIMHDPRYVVKLQSERFRVCLGYLILPRNTFGVSGDSSNSTYLKSLTYGMNDYKDMMGIDRLYIDLMKIVKRHLGDKEFVTPKNEVKKMLVRCVKEIDEDTSGEFKVRFIPPNRMEHFTINPRTFFPYGEGIFHKCTFSAKLLLALETALTIKRLTDSSDSRIFYIETGLPRNVKDAMEEVKEARHKRKISLDKFGEISSISSMVTTFTDWYIPTANGKRYIEPETLPPTVQMQQLSEELKYMRDRIVSNIGVPPSYLNVEENLSNKSALAHENMIFARMIVAYQVKFNKHLENLYNKIYKLLYGRTIPDGIAITFAPPKMLQVEREVEHMSQCTQLITTLSEVGINKEYLKRKYLDIDWDELSDYEIKSKLKDKLENDNSDDNGGMPGGF